ncbi:Hypothetical predicted protein [Octopus vulgaris]|uniref:Uncharacterized protein n=1 Tax=Octopus vulgaris TaxID=6645 RepID=A0AA36C1H0_OCTVU|nr:Hypothetical predicted protein [Octopus vulgaris]
MMFNIQMRRLFFAWIVLSVIIQCSLQAQDNAKPKSKPKSGSPVKPRKPAPEKPTKKGPDAESPKKPEAMTQPRANFLLMSLDWLRNNVVISDNAMKKTWSSFTDILKKDKIMQNDNWQQQLVFLISQNAHLTDFVHNLPYLGYQPGHGVQHPYHPGIYNQMYQMPHNYRISPQLFNQNGHHLNPGMINSGISNINGCPVVNVTLNLQINSKGHCWTSVTAPQQSLKNFFILAAYQNKCFKFEIQHRNSRLPPALVTSSSSQREYVRSINGIEETSTMMWSIDELNGPKDLELSGFLPRHNAIIIINYADSNLIKNKYSSNH